MVNKNCILSINILWIPLKKLSSDVCEPFQLLRQMVSKAFYCEITIN